MKRYFWSLVFAILVTSCINWVVANTKSTEHQNVYYNVGRVVGLGQCTTDKKCSYVYVDKFNNTKSAVIETPVFLGQLVYQECWYEEAQGDQCYVDYQPLKN